MTALGWFYLGGAFVNGIYAVHHVVTRWDHIKNLDSDAHPVAIVFQVILYLGRAIVFWPYDLVQEWQRPVGGCLDCGVTCWTEEEWTAHLASHEKACVER